MYKNRVLLTAIFFQATFPGNIIFLTIWWELWSRTGLGGLYKLEIPYRLVPLVVSAVVIYLFGKQARFVKLNPAQGLLLLIPFYGNYFAIKAASLISAFENGDMSDSDLNNVSGKGLIF